MLYYDLKETILLEASINAFEVALTPNRTSSLSKENRKVYKNFISYLKKMYNYLLNPNITTNEIKQLKDFIEKTNQTSNRKWLIMRIKSMLSKT